MIARLGPPPTLAVHASRFQARLQNGAEQKVIHAYARISTEGISKVVPIGIDRLIRMGLANGARPTLCNQFRIGLTGLRKEHGIPDPALRLVGVEWRRDGVVIAAENDRPPRFYQRSCIGYETIKPRELVIELRSWRRVAVRKIDAADGQTINLGFEIAALQVIRATW